MKLNYWLKIFKIELDLYENYKIFFLESYWQLQLVIRQYSKRDWNNFNIRPMPDERINIRQRQSAEFFRLEKVGKIVITLSFRVGT